MASDDQKKVVPGDGDIGGKDDEAREDSTAHVYHVLESRKGVFKKFLAPDEKYKGVLKELGIEVFDPKKASSQNAILSNSLFAGRIRVTLKDDKTTASLMLLCAPAQLGTAPTALLGKKIYEYEIVGASIPRKRTLV
jgi:hypothetical protein